MKSFFRSGFFTVFILLLSIAFTKNAWSQIPASKYEFTVTLSDGVQLDCTKFVPNSSPPPNGYPCIICCHGYGLSKEDSYGLASDESAYGFYTFCYSMRGQGNSGGYSNLISTTEMNDLFQIIQYVKDDANTNDDRIAIIGGSQGGMIPFMAACNGANIRCLVTELASPEFASNWIANGCVKMTLLWTLSYDQSVVRYNENVKELRRLAVSEDRDDWNHLASELPRNRDFIDKVKDNKVPLLISNTWQDKFFNTLGMIKSRDLLQVPYRMYFGAVSGHGGDVDANEDRFHEQLVDKWFYFWLNDQNNNITKENKFIYDATSFAGNSLQFTRFESPVWPPKDVSDIKFYFAPYGKLSLSPNVDASQSSASLDNEVRDHSMTLLNAVYYNFTGSFESKFRKDEVRFDSDPLDKDTKMAGTPQVKLFYSSSADICQFNFQILEIGSDGTENFVTSVNYTDRNYQVQNIKDALIDGDSSSHIFRRGSRIRVIMTNLDTRTNDSFLRTFPYVLPVLRNGISKMFTYGDNSSYLLLQLSQ